MVGVFLISNDMAMKRILSGWMAMHCIVYPFVITHQRSPLSNATFGMSKAADDPSQNEDNDCCQDSIFDNFSGLKGS